MEDSLNPYRAPGSSVAAGDTPALEAASKWRRFFTLVIDYIGFVALGGVIGAAVGLTLGEAGVRKMQQLPDLVIGLPIMFSYYFAQETLFGRTLGKWVTGTRVVAENGDAPSAGQVAGRTLSRFIPFEPFTIFGKDRRALHDKLARTLVVRCR